MPQEVQTIIQKSTKDNNTNVNNYYYKQLITAVSE